MMRLRQKKLYFQIGIYNDIHEVIDAINIMCKVAESHFYFESKKHLAVKSW